MIENNFTLGAQPPSGFPEKSGQVQPLPGFCLSGGEFRDKEFSILILSEYFSRPFSIFAANIFLMGKNKLKHWAELQTFSNVFQLRKDLKGKWNEDVFQNQNPITLELACGKGEYTLTLAKKFFDRNFIGIDIKGARIWRGAKTALEEKIPNVAFLRTYIDHLEDYFESREVNEIWITFPDPYREKSKARKRLTSEMFLPRYRKILKPGGFIHLKTDDLQLYQFTLEKIAEFKCNVIFSSQNLYSEKPHDEILSIKTFYEEQHLAERKTIKYIKFTFS